MRNERRPFLFFFIIFYFLFLFLFYCVTLRYRNATWNVTSYYTTQRHNTARAFHYATVTLQGALLPSSATEYDNGKPFFFPFPTAFFLRKFYGGNRRSPVFSPPKPFSKNSRNFSKKSLDIQNKGCYSYYQISYLLFERL